jgi:predicted RNA-binding Zn-ribbon protein involved in translation (DUF1610 family)
MMQCPECGSSSVLTLGKRNWPYPVALVAVIGATLALLHQAASPIDYRCPACGLRFARRTTSARFALLVMILFIVGVPLLLIFFFLRSMP